MNFNFCLIVFLLEFREYVVVYEFVYFKYRNYLKVFWSFVFCFYLDYCFVREELKKWWSILELNLYWWWLEGRE